MLTVCVRAWFADVGIHIEHDDGGRAVADAHVVMMPMHKGPFKGRKFQFLYTGFPASIPPPFRCVLLDVELNSEGCGGMTMVENTYGCCSYSRTVT